MTSEEKIEIFIKMIFEPVENKPGYVWFSKRNFQIISIETLQKLFEDRQKVRLRNDYSIDFILHRRFSWRIWSDSNSISNESKGE